MTIAAYNLEDEERFLKSYLQRTTVVSTNRQDGNLVKFDAPNNDSKNCDDDDELIGKRVFCCNTSRSLYCPDCCSVLVPKEHRPQRFIRQESNNSKGQRQQVGSSFPFQFMDVVLGVKERRTASTGIQLMCISNMIAEATDLSREYALNHPEQRRHSELAENKSETTTSSGSKYNDNVDCGNRGINDTNGGEWWRNIKLIDLNKGDTLPQYSTNLRDRKLPDPMAAAEEDEEGTYVLFPQEGKSVPISAVAHKIKRLVVLDIKWTRSFNVQLFSADHHKIMVSTPSEAGGGKCYNPLASLKDLPFVHLEYPPQNSNFWRWHNRGVGMVSTIEAIYFAAREASVALQQRRDIGEEEKGVDDSNYGQQGCIEECDDDENFVDILWLFALQRSIVRERSLQEGRPIAFSEEAKAMARALRKQDPPETR
jgi:hypothetical protein